MRVKVQRFWNGTTKPECSGGMGYRALVCGGIRVYSAKWDRKTAAAMLDALEAVGMDRGRIRFQHV